MSPVRRQGPDAPRRDRHQHCRGSGESNHRESEGDVDLPSMYCKSRSGASPCVGVPICSTCSAAMPRTEGIATWAEALQHGRTLSCSRLLSLPRAGCGRRPGRPSGMNRPKLASKIGSVACAVWPRRSDASRANGRSAPAFGHQSTSSVAQMIRRSRGWRCTRSSPSLQDVLPMTRVRGAAMHGDDLLHGLPKAATRVLQLPSGKSRRSTKRSLDAPSGTVGGRMAMVSKPLSSSCC